MIFLFNVGGYYIVFWGLRLETDQQLSARLDAGLYDPNATIELKIPVALPYPIYTEGFKRVDGRFEHNGEFYKLVKHKLQNDTLYIVCIRDGKTRELVNAMTDYVRLTQTFPASHEKANNFLGKLAKDFLSRATGGVTEHAGYSVTITFGQLTRFFDPRAIPVHSPPPKSGILPLC
jgi:hypothetical protein